ncbi:Hypothetical predicted protein [Octopus vulgaris]|uniref:Uncharacterized protein n=1 Tax=Octopus vulgaris TaxID=6645 RepID=A0AA36FDA8_OCTVU|nr:Hypothetical predicted protein [Octopus vulgaris]
MKDLLRAPYCGIEPETIFQGELIICAKAKQLSDDIGANSFGKSDTTVLDSLASKESFIPVIETVLDQELKLRQCFYSH